MADNKDPQQQQQSQPDQKKTTDQSASPKSKDSGEKPEISADPIKPQTLNESVPGKSGKQQTQQNKDQQQQSSKPTASSQQQHPPSQQQQTQATTSTDTQQASPGSQQQKQQPLDPKTNMSQKQTKEQPTGHQTPPQSSTSPQSQQQTSDQQSQSNASFKETMPNQGPSFSEQDMTPKIQQADQVPGDKSQKEDKSQKDDSLPQVTTGNGKKSGSKYPIVLSILGLFAMAGIGFAGYQFYQTRYASDDQGADQPQQQQEQQQEQESRPNIVLDNKGNVLSIDPQGEETTIINKANFETTGITGFTNLKMSPDESKFCVQTMPPAPVTAIYVSDLTGENVKEVGTERKDCFWLDDNNTIVYESASGVNEPVNIYKYDYQTEQETQLTRAGAEGVIRVYNITGIAEDGKTVSCTYNTVGSDETTDCEIDPDGPLPTDTQEETPIPTEEA